MLTFGRFVVVIGHSRSSATACHHYRAHTTFYVTSMHCLCYPAFSHFSTIPACDGQTEGQTAHICPKAREPREQGGQLPTEL